MPIRQHPARSSDPGGSSSTRSKKASSQGSRKRLRTKGSHDQTQQQEYSASQANRWQMPTRQCTAPSWDPGGSSSSSGLEGILQGPNGEYLQNSATNPRNTTCACGHYSQSTCQPRSLQARGAGQRHTKSGLCWLRGPPREGPQGGPKEGTHDTVPISSTAKKEKAVVPRTRRCVPELTRHRTSQRFMTGLCCKIGLCL